MTDTEKLEAAVEQVINRFIKNSGLPWHHLFLNGFQWGYDLIYFMS